MSKEKLQWFEESLLEVRKVTKVTTGWRRMRFRATVLVWDRGWNIGIGVGKGTDVAIAVSKATHDAYKNITQVPVTKSGSVPYQVNCKYKSCLVTLRPASSGTWLKAGSSVRIVLELAGYSNILSKVIGSNNALNNALAVVSQLMKFKVNPEHVQDVKAIVKVTTDSTDDKKNPKYKKEVERKPLVKKDSIEKKPVAKTEEISVEKTSAKKVSAKKPVEKTTSSKDESKTPKKKA